jgi:hypothetical protein
MRFEYGRVLLVTGEYRELRLMCWCQQHQDRYRGVCYLIAAEIPQLTPELQRVIERTRFRQFRFHPESCGCTLCGGPQDQFGPGLARGGYWQRQAFLSASATMLNVLLALSTNASVGTATMPAWLPDRHPTG